MPDYLIHVNGKNKKVNVDSDTPLLWVLRDTLGLTGTKYSCGEGICGSCTVLIDGKAEHSCSVPITQVVGKSIITIEGLAEQPNHPVFKVWLEEEVSQCGYCQPGQLMTLVALLNEIPRPSKAQIIETMSTVLCRCGTYARIDKAVDMIIGEGKK